MRIVSVTACLLTLALGVDSSTASADTWMIDREKSRLGFVASYDEIEFDSSFREFSGDIRFDPAAMENSSFNITVAIRSVDSDSLDRDEGMMDPDWFDVGQHPDATFFSTGFERQGETSYRVSGELTIKGQSMPVMLIMNWNQTVDSASLEGYSIVDRRDFRIGSGDWADDDTIGFEVKIVFDLALTKP